MDDLLGRLLLLLDITIRENVANPFKTGDLRDEADAAIVVLDGEGDRPKAGIYGVRLVRQLKARQRFGWGYGRLVKVTVQGKEALELTDPGPTDTEKVRAWLTAYAPHYLTGSPAPPPTAPAAALPAAPATPQATPSAPYAPPAAGGAWPPGTAPTPPTAPPAPPAASTEPPF
ncbi:hypothetical protein [Actinomadura rayongensis]|uniref:hypothetical protein n=1 Tax=Actinomadura rayongensis TaxID=1429076 RepID=UPI0019277621|nr:hypothetical protein [Actinomadura rayongensis]